jgi:hypothetical protein
MHAPSPAGIVVNEYYDWTEADFTQPSQAAVFDRPASPNCTSTIQMSSVEAARYVGKHFPHLYSEIIAAFPKSLV